MGFVVVRCPGCRGASRVGPDAVGLLVVCPRCSDPFLAVEEAAPVAPPRRPDRPRERDRDRPRRHRAEPVAPAGPGAPVVIDPHDPHAVRAGGLPLSVMVGLALLPFAIPLVWLIAPLVAGRPPALSVATPVALAVAAAALCLAVVFTVDWTPATRLKGVLILLGLTYLAGLSLYFLRKEMVDRVGAQFGPRWREFRPPDGPPYTVDLPGRPVPAPNDRPLPTVPLACYKAGHPGWAGDFVCVVGAGDDPDPETADDDFFREVGRAVGGFGPGQAVAPGPGGPAGPPGREWRIIGRGVAPAAVRVYRADGVVYYLSAEGPDLDAHARRVFESFKPGP